MCAICVWPEWDFQYVSVLERHPTNPDHLHMHVAWRGEGFVNSQHAPALLAYGHR